MKQDIAIFTPMANEEKNAKKFVLEVLSYQKFLMIYIYLLSQKKLSQKQISIILKFYIDQKNYQETMYLTFQL